MRRILFPMVLVIIVLTSFPCLASWRFNGVPVYPSPHQQTEVNLVSDGMGGAILVWRETFTDDLRLQRLDGQGNPQWGSSGVLLSTGGGPYGQQEIADGSGGVIITWTDERSGLRSIFAQKIDSTGTPQWTPGGVAVCTDPANQGYPTLVTDGSGGAIFFWQDDRGATGYDIYTQRVNAAGVPQWTPNGVELCRGDLAQTNPVAVSNGNGGARVAFLDQRNGNTDIYWHKVNNAGVPGGSLSGFPLCTAPGNQYDLAITTDGNQGFIVAWLDRRDGGYAIYGQRVDGLNQEVWDTNGIPFSNQNLDADYPALISDGNGGANICWVIQGNDSKYHNYAQRVDGDGDIKWTPNGVPVATDLELPTFPTITTDGDQGAIIFWDNIYTNGGIFGQRLDSHGVAQWGPNGAPVSNQLLSKPIVVFDGKGGAIATWLDISGPQTNVIAQRVEGRYGEWGNVEPVIDAVDDNPGDQGGTVVVRWQASGRDQSSDPLIAFYSLWRATDSPVAKVGSPVTMEENFSGSMIWREEKNAEVIYWEWVANQAAAYMPGYSLLAATRQDSTGGDPATHQFKILAHDWSTPARLWESNSASGHSVDNLAPGAPLDLTAFRVDSDVQLIWNEPAATDLRDYAIYRSTEPNVAPEPENFIGWSTETNDLDQGVPAADLYYMVTAFDIHDNQGPASNEALVSGVTAVGDSSQPNRLMVRPNWPNPTSGATALSIGLPVRSDFTVSVYDVRGRRIHHQLIKDAASGWNTVHFSGKDQSGKKLASGVYYYQVKANGKAVVNKMVLTR